MTDVTTQTTINTLNVSQHYNVALYEAAEYMKAHKDEKELPDEIVAKAIGHKPNYCDSPDADTMLEARKAFNEYRKKTQLFISQAKALAEK